jgi:lipoprotein NlpD
MQSIIIIIAAAWRSCSATGIGRCCTILLLTLLVSGCISGQAQTSRHAGNGWYTVKPTDTLHSIAWRYGLDHKTLASWNQISEDYVVNPGQKLVMRNLGDQSLGDETLGDEIVAQTPVNSTSSNSSGSSTTDQSSVKLSVSSTKAKVVKVPTTTKPPSRWLWPVKGKLLNTFSIKRLDRRGIDIAGQLGQDVRATAAGKVVYSGDGLIGYGNLIIIKHNETYLSAYAYCKERLVNEGTRVQAGAIIAKMGQHKNKLARLHFEIRKNGKPVDPMKYLSNK